MKRKHPRSNLEPYPRLKPRPQKDKSKSGSTKRGQRTDSKTGRVKRHKPGDPSSSLELSDDVEPAVLDFTTTPQIVHYHTHNHTPPQNQFLNTTQEQGVDLDSVADRFLKVQKPVFDQLNQFHKTINETVRVNSGAIQTVCLSNGMARQGNTCRHSNIYIFLW